MASVIYASLSAFLIVWLSLNVIKKRRKYQVNIGDGGNEDLMSSMAAQSNAIEYIPIALVCFGIQQCKQFNCSFVRLSINYRADNTCKRYFIFKSKNPYVGDANHNIYNYRFGGY